MKRTKIRLGLVDTEAKPNSSFLMEDIQPFSKLEDLKSDFLEPINYATLEKNFFTLNGEHIILEENNSEDIGICSKEMTNENGEFTAYPMLTINLSTLTHIGGLTFIFGKYDYCNDLDITYYLDDVEVVTLNYKPDNVEYYCGDSITKYTFNKAVITFKKTFNPYRYIKITQIEFGRILTFSNDNIISCNILEELNLISNEISINTCDFEIYSKDDKFNILNPQGIYADLKTKLPIDVYEVDDTKKSHNLMGRFYLKSWKSKGNDQATFEAEDFMSILDSLDYNSPKDTYNSIQDDKDKRTYMKFSDFINDVTNNKYLFDCYESDVLDNKGLNGVIFKDTIKNVLQKILFTFGILSDTSRNKKIRFFNLDNKEENLKTITSDRIFSDSVEVTKISEYNEFIVYGYGYDESTDFNNKDTSKFFTIKAETLGSNVTFEFDSPQSYCDLGLNPNGIPIFINTNNYPINSITPFKISFKLNEIGDISFYSQEQEENKSMYVYTSPDKMINEQVNSLTVDECELIHKDSETEVNYIVASDVAKRLYNHYRNLYKIEFQFEFNNERVGDYVEVETEYGRKIKGNIISLDIDLLSETATCIVEGRITNE